MIKEFNFPFADLVIDLHEINTVLGYTEGPLPSPFDEYLKEVLQFASTLTDIRATYRVIEKINIGTKPIQIVANGKTFRVGKTISNELKGADKLAFFVCTAGKTISEKSTTLLHGEDPVLGYVYDILGSALVEAAGDKMQQVLKKEVEHEEMKITNRYSPGYCQWSVADQPMLFSFFEPSPCGVILTDSALMYPIKSISGIIGIGKEVNYREYQCTLCSSVNCVFRKSGTTEVKTPLKKFR